VIFISEFQKSILLKSNGWQIDGTFKSVPSHFTQLITIYGKYLGKFHPLCYILIKTKTEIAYENAFNVVNKFIEKPPNYIIIDFEKSFYNVLSRVYKESNICGCNLHFGKILWRRIQIEGLILQ
jgi:hypothetical protein